MPAVRAVLPPRQPAMSNSNAHTRVPLAMGTQQVCFDVGSSGASGAGVAAAAATTTTTTHALPRRQPPPLPPASNNNKTYSSSVPVTRPRPPPQQPSALSLLRSAAGVNDDAHGSRRSRTVAPLPLHGARAKVRPPLRPDTPLELLSSLTTSNSTSNNTRSSSSSSGAAAVFGVLRPSRRGTRLTALRTATATASASQLVESAAAAAPIVPERFVMQLRSVYSEQSSSGAAAAATATAVAVGKTDNDNDDDVCETTAHDVVSRVRDLMRWLAHPHHTLWPAMVEFACEVMHTTCTRLRTPPMTASSCALPVPARRVHIAVVLASLLLRHTAMPSGISNNNIHSSSSTSVHEKSSSDDSAVVAEAEVLQRAATVAALLRVVAERGGVSYLHDELVLEPLCHMLDSDVLLATRPAVVYDVLATLLACVQAPQSQQQQQQHGADGGDSDKEDDDKDDDDDAEAAAAQHRSSAPLVTLGVLPRVNALVTRLLRDGDAATAATPTHVTLVCAACMLYRQLATHYVHHLCSVGTVSLLTQLLLRFAACADIVAATARVLAKVVCDGEGATALCADAQLVPSVLRALLTQVQQQQQQATQKQQQQQTALLVSRLCSVLARLGEDVASVRDAVAQHGPVLLPLLLQCYVQPVAATAVVADGAAAKDDETSSKDGVAQQQQTITRTATMPTRSTLTLVQDVVWLVGVAARSEQCTTRLVWLVLPTIVSLLQSLAYTPQTRLTCIYALMCVSNLSFFFAAMEAEADAQADAAVTTSADTTAHDTHDTLMLLYDALGLIVAGYLFEGDTEAAVEATRILGNVSYTRRGRDWLEQHRCDEVVVLFLGHEDMRIVYNCFGVVLNLTAATSCRVVADAELLAMLLQYTGRYTRQADIDAMAAAAAAAQQRRRSSSNSSNSSGGGKEKSSHGDDAAEDGADVYDDAREIAELVAKVLENVRGLMLPETNM